MNTNNKNETEIMIELKKQVAKRLNKWCGSRIGFSVTGSEFEVHCKAHPFQYLFTPYFVQCENNLGKECLSSNSDLNTYLREVLSKLLHSDTIPIIFVRVADYKAPLVIMSIKQVKAIGNATHRPMSDEVAQCLAVQVQVNEGDSSFVSMQIMPFNIFTQWMNPAVLKELHATRNPEKKQVRGKLKSESSRRRRRSN